MTDRTFIVLDRAEAARALRVGMDLLGLPKPPDAGLVVTVFDPDGDRQCLIRCGAKVPPGSGVTSLPFALAVSNDGTQVAIRASDRVLGWFSDQRRLTQAQKDWIAAQVRSPVEIEDDHPDWTTVDADGVRSFNRYDVAPVDTF